MQTWGVTFLKNESDFLVQEKDRAAESLLPHSL